MKYAIALHDSNIDRKYDTMATTRWCCANIIGQMSNHYTTNALHAFIL